MLRRSRSSWLLILGLLLATLAVGCADAREARERNAAPARRYAERELHAPQRYVQVLFHQVMQTAACNRLHRVEQRGARWLLQIHDAVGADRFALTQESLALMLSVQRPTVTLVAGMLRRAGAIEYSRGRVTVISRAALEAVACDCYRVMQAQFATLPA